jgi:TonB family protein
MHRPSSSLALTAALLARDGPPASDAAGPTPAPRLLADELGPPRVAMHRTTLLLTTLLACTAPPADDSPAPAAPIASPPTPAGPIAAAPPRESPNPRLPITSEDCAVAAPAHTLTATATNIDLDGTPYPDAAAVADALTAIRGEPLALAFDGDLTRHDLDPLLAVLARLTPRPRLAVRVASADPLAGPRHIPIVGIDIDAGAALTPAYYLALTGSRTRLLDLVDTSRKVPDELALAGLSVLVTASERTSWDMIAGAFARACGGGHLVERADVDGRRVPTITRSMFATPPTTGYGEPDVVRRIVRANIRDVRTCYDLALARDPLANGRVAIRFTISDSGKVTDASVLASTMKHAEVGPCIAAAVRRWKFPKPDLGGATLTYPFVLEPG